MRACIIGLIPCASIKMSAWRGGWGFEHVGTHWLAFGLAGALLMLAAGVAWLLPGKAAPVRPMPSPG